MHARSKGELCFDIFNIAALCTVAAVTLYPFFYTLGISFATNAELSRRDIYFFPLEPTLLGYRMLLQDPNILAGIGNSTLRTVTGTLLTLLATSLIAYPLSRRDMPWRRRIVFFVLFTAVFSGGIVPRYIVIKDLGLIDNRLVYILPLLLTPLNILVLRSFFERIPESLIEAAKIDGGNDFVILFKIVLPLSKPALATIGLWTAVMHWNQWFDGLVYISSDSKQVLQIFLQRIVVEGDVNQLRFGVEALDMAEYSSEAVKAAAVVVTVLPLLLVYPFLQRYFIRGITLGGVKE